MEELFKTLGDENRLRILNLLINDKLLCVCEIEIILEMTQSNVSRHLSKLKNIGIITPEKENQWVHYKISNKFKEENDLLFDFLQQKFKNNVIYLKDLNRYHKYRINNLSCQVIVKEKNRVLNIIR